MVRRARSKPISLLQVAIALATAALLSYAILLLEVRFQGNRTLRRVEELREEVRALRNERDRLEAELQYVRTDEYVEKVAHEKLKMVRPGEKLFVPVPDTADTAPEPAPAQAFEPTPPAPKTTSLWQRLKGLLFGSSGPAGGVSSGDVGD